MSSYIYLVGPISLLMSIFYYLFIFKKQNIYIYITQRSNSSIIVLYLGIYNIFMGEWLVQLTSPNLVVVRLKGEVNTYL